MNDIAIIGTTNAIQTVDAFDQDTLLKRFVDYIGREPTTTRGYMSCLKQFFKWMNETGVRNPTRADVLAYKEYLNGNTFGKTGAEPLTAGTKQQYIRAVKQFFKWTASEGLYPNIADNIHTAKVQATTHKRDAFTQEEVEHIAGTIDRSTTEGKRLYAMFMLAAYRGLRTVEISRARVKDLERKRDGVYLRIWGKGHGSPDEKRYLVPDIIEAIDAYLEARGDKISPNSPLFLNTSNKGSAGTHLRKRNQLTGEMKDYTADGTIAPTTISAMLKEAMVNAGYDSSRLTAHSLRHAFGTEATVNGDMRAAQIALRHNNISVTQVYVHDNDVEQDRELMMKMYRKRHGDTTDAELQEGIDLLKEISATDPEKMGAILEYMRSFRRAQAG